MNFLDKVLQQKEKEIKELKNKYADNPFVKLFSSDSHILIAEVKPKSPSGGILYDGDLVELAKTYETAGADAISVLTDKEFFGGSPDLLRQIKATVNIPIFRKDFIVSKDQLAETLLIGADAVLLIVSILKDEKLKEFIDLAYALGIIPIVEVLNESELDTAIKAGARVIGVNSRDLKTMTIDQEMALNVLSKIPSNIIALLFSGVQDYKDVNTAITAGAKGVLVGTALLKSTDVSRKVKELKGYE